MAFDLLNWNGRDLMGRPLRDRRARLEDVVAGSELVFAVRRLAPEGLQAWRQAIERGYGETGGEGRGQSLRGRAHEAVAQGEGVRGDRCRGPVAAVEDGTVTRSGVVRCSGLYA